MNIFLDGRGKPTSDPTFQFLRQMRHCEHHYGDISKHALTDVKLRITRRRLDDAVD